MSLEQENSEVTNHYVLTREQRNELDKRCHEHKKCKDSQMDAFAFLDELKSKYNL
jgi:hypothetical protein